MSGHTLTVGTVDMRILWAAALMAVAFAGNSRAADDADNYAEARRQIHEKLGIVVNANPMGRVVVAKVQEDGPAAAAGIHEGDVLLLADQNAVISTKQLYEAIHEKERSGAIHLTVGRGDDVHSLRVGINTERKQQAEAPTGEEVLILGMTVARSETGDPIVQDVSVASPAWKAGIRTGDQIVAVENFKPQTLDELGVGARKLMADESRTAVTVDFARNGEKLSVSIDLTGSDVAQTKEDAPPPADYPPESAPQQTAAGEGYPAGQDAPYDQSRYGGGGGTIVDVGAGGQDGAQQGVAVAQLHRVQATGARQTSTGEQSERVRDQPAPPAPQSQAVSQNPSQAAAGRQPLRNRSVPRSGVPTAGSSQQGMQTGGIVGRAAFVPTQTGLAATVEVNGLPPGSYVAVVGNQGDLQQALPTDVSRRGGTGRFRGGRETPPVTDGQPPATEEGRRATDEQPRATGTAPAGARGVRPGVGAGNAPNAQAPVQTPAAPNRPQVTSQRAGGAGSPVQTQPLRQVAPPGAGPGLSPTADPPAANQQQPRQPVVPRTQRQPQTVPQRRTQTQPQTVQPGGAAGPQLELGTLQVDQQGVGRLTQPVEGIQTAQLIGRMVILYQSGQNAPLRQRDAAAGQQSEFGVPAAAGMIQYAR